MGIRGCRGGGGIIPLVIGGREHREACVGLRAGVPAVFYCAIIEQRRRKLAHEDSAVSRRFG